MAVIRKITDGTTTIDLNDLTNFKLVEPLDLGVGDTGEDVTFVITALWKDITQDARAALRRSLQQLLNKAKVRDQYRLTEDWVWLEVRAENETNTRYAVIKSGLADSAKSTEQGDQFQDLFRVAITREAEWRPSAPTSAGTASVNGVTVYNKSDADGDNWVTVADSGGDAPTQLKIITQVTNNGVVSLKIGGKYGSTAMLNGFNPWLNATDLANNGGGSKAADTAAPADERLEMSADGTPYWNINASDLDHYRGNYRVIAYATRNSGTGTATIGIYHGSQSAALKTVAVSTTSLMHDLGTISVPDFPLVDSIKPTTGSYRFSLPFDLTGTATFYIYAVALIPLDVSYFMTSPNGLTGTNTQWVVDGYTHYTYLANSSGNQILGFPLIPSGRYPEARQADEGNLRLYFFGDQELTTPTFNDTMDITVRTKAGYLTTMGTG